MPDTSQHPRAITFGYVNCCGKFSIRRVTPERIYWGTTKYHPEPSWLMKGYDHDKGKNRDFALQDCDMLATRETDALVF